MADSCNLVSIHHERSKSMIARSRSERAIGVRLPSGGGNFEARADPGRGALGSASSHAVRLSADDFAGPSPAFAGPSAFVAWLPTPVWRSPVAQATCNRQAVGSNPTTGSFSSSPARAAR